MTFFLGRDDVGEIADESGFLLSSGGAEAPLTASRALQIASDVYGWGGNVDAPDAQVLADLAALLGNEEAFRAALANPSRSSDGRLFYPSVALDRAARYYGWGSAANVDAQDVGPITALAAAAPTWAAFDNSLSSPARDADGHLSFSAPQPQPQLNGYVSSLSSGSGSSMVAVRDMPLGTLDEVLRVEPPPSSSSVASLVPLALVAGLAYLLLGGD